MNLKALTRGTSETMSDMKRFQGVIEATSSVSLPASIYAFVTESNNNTAMQRLFANDGGVLPHFYRLISNSVVYYI